MAANFDERIDNLITGLEASDALSAYQFDIQKGHIRPSDIVGDHGVAVYRSATNEWNRGLKNGASQIILSIQVQLLTKRQATHAELETVANEFADAVYSAIDECRQRNGTNGWIALMAGSSTQSERTDRSQQQVREDIDVAMRYWITH